MTNITEIGAFDAKTHFSEILRRVEAGERFIITRHGRKVAEIGASLEDSSKDMKNHRIATMAKIKKLGKNIQNDCKRRGLSPLTAENIRDLRDEGRP